MSNLFLLLNKCHCSYGCIFCDRGYKITREIIKKQEKFDDYKTESIQLQKMIYDGFHKENKKRLTIGGNEPLNHPNIIKIINFAKKVGYKNITIQTSGLKFSNHNYLLKFISGGMNEVEIPIYSSKSEVHDKIVRRNGSYNILIKAIENLSKLNVKLSMRTVILKQNVSEIKKIITKFKIVDIIFPFPIQFKDISNETRIKLYTQICPKLTDIPLDILAKLKLNIPCINNKKYVEINHERKRIEKDQIIIEYLNKDEAPYLAKSKPKKCKSCKEFNNCEGIYTPYLDIYGDEEFHPII